MSINHSNVYYAHAAANLNSEYSKYAKVECVHYLCTIALQTALDVCEGSIGYIHMHVGLIHLISG